MRCVESLAPPSPAQDSSENFPGLVPAEAPFFSFQLEPEGHIIHDHHPGKTEVPLPQKL